MLYTSLNPDKALIWRIIHRDNLPWVLDHGLHCGNSAVKAPGWVSIGNRYQAEALIHRHVPITGLLGIVCYTEALKQDIEQEILARHLSLPVHVRTGWYFS